MQKSNAEPNDLLLPDVLENRTRDIKNVLTVWLAVKVISFLCFVLFC